LSAFDTDWYGKSSLVMLSFGKITIYHYVKGAPAFDFGNTVTLTSFTKQKEIIDLEQIKVSSTHGQIVHLVLLSEFILADSSGELLLTLITWTRRE
jgi:hypothetical protein